jgi:hypothetical protein
MFIKRSGNTNTNNTSSDLISSVKNDTQNVNIVNIDKAKLIQILKELRKIETEAIDNLFESIITQDLMLELTLMNAGFSPKKDDSIQKFNEMVTLYKTDDEVKECLSLLTNGKFK